MNSVDPFAELAAKSSAPSERVLSALRAEVRADAKPRQLQSRAKRAGLSILALAIGFTLTTAKILGHDPGTFFAALAVCSLSVGALLFAGVIPGAGRASPGMRRTLLAVLCIGTFTALALHARYFLPIDDFAHEDHSTRAAHCATYSLLAGVICASGLMIIWRRTDPFSPGLTGALIGFLGGLIGTVSVSLTCRAEEGIHLTLAHGVGAVILAALCSIWGRKWLSP